MASIRVSRVVIGILATQLVLGCQKPEEDGLGVAKGPTVPASLDHPADMAGSWQEAKGKQIVDLNTDGSCVIHQKVSLGAEVTKGAALDSMQKIPCKWGTKDGKFYFTDINGSPPLSYEYKLEGDKISMSGPGTKLTYSRVVEKKKS